MKALMIPLLIVLLGIGGGTGAGLFLRPAPEPVETMSVEEPVEEVFEEQASATSFARLNNQFVIPLVNEAQIKGLVVLTLSIEVTEGEQSIVYELEPKLRDGFNSVLFRHANTGGFDGVFTSPPKLNALRLALLEEAQAIVGPVARGVLVTDIVRQDA